MSTKPRKHEYLPLPLVFKDLSNPRMLTDEEAMEVCWNEYSLDEIDYLISAGCVTERQLVMYYNNEFWRDEP